MTAAGIHFQTLVKSVFGRLQNFTRPRPALFVAWWLIFEFEPVLTNLHCVLADDATIGVGMGGNCAGQRFRTCDNQSFVDVMTTRPLTDKRRPCATQ